MSAADYYGVGRIPHQQEQQQQQHVSGAEQQGRPHPVGIDMTEHYLASFPYECLHSILRGAILMAVITTLVMDNSQGSSRLVHTW